MHNGPIDDEMRERIERNREFLLGIKVMHERCNMTWAECAKVYEKKTGRAIRENALRKKVHRAADMNRFVHVYEFPSKIVVSASELTFRGCIACSLKRFFGRIRGFFTRNRREGAKNG